MDAKILGSNKMLVKRYLQRAKMKFKIFGAFSLENLKTQGLEFVRGHCFPRTKVAYENGAI